jgi:hypothetical protein
MVVSIQRSVAQAKSKIDWRRKWLNYVLKENGVGAIAGRF